MSNKSIKNAAASVRGMLQGAGKKGLALGYIQKWLESNGYLTPASPAESREQASKRTLDFAHIMRATGAANLGHLGIAEDIRFTSEAAELIRAERMKQDAEEEKAAALAAPEGDTVTVEAPELVVIKGKGTSRSFRGKIKKVVVVFMAIFLVVVLWWYQPIEDPRWWVMIFHQIFTFVTGGQIM